MNLAWAAAGGALFCLGYAGFGFWPCALVAWAALWHALDRARGIAGPALLGFVFGEVAHAGGFSWLLRLTDVFLAGNDLLGAALFSLHSLVFGAMWAAHAALFRAARVRGVPLAVAGPCALVLVEWLFPQLFPAHLADAFVDRTAFAQLASLGGPLLLSALAAFVNAALLELVRWLAGARAFPRAATLAAVAALAAASAFGAWRLAEIACADAAAPALRVGAVQANAAPLEKRERPEQLHRTHLAMARELLAQGALDLVVWPETVISRGIAGPFPLAGDLIRGDNRVPLLFGAASVRTEDGARRIYNSALLVERDGTIRAGYDKRLLVPFAEWAPAALARFFPNAQRFGAAHELRAVVLDGAPIATPICYEAAVSGYVRELVHETRAQWIVMLANDGWFGDSHLPHIHLAVARLRAIENGRWTLRATNSGISALIDPAGRIVARTPLLEPALLRGELRPRSERTLYARLGEWPGWVAAGLLLALGTRREGRDAVREVIAGAA
ncbi:MAG TPA: apolipoprotein N-acyltransferase [Myxococcota bacterium]|nr:apolipoprotein N-acyltransferase [Myxococcota bacterium]